MLPNSDNLCCNSEGREFKPESKLLKLDMVPFSFMRITDHSFYYSDVRDSMTTNIYEMRIDKEGNTYSK